MYTQWIALTKHPEEEDIFKVIGSIIGPPDRSCFKTIYPTEKDVYIMDRNTPHEVVLMN